MQTPLLSTADFDFWEEYTSSYQHFDSLFCDLYKSFIYFNQEEDEELDDVVVNFINSVNNFLIANNKRYSEMWRINVINDSKYDILNNVDETIEQTTNENNMGSVTTGKRTDVNNTEIGNQKFDSVNKVTPFNSNNENVDTSNSNESGTRNDVESFTKGQETDTSIANNTTTFNSRRYGNIGVMTSTQIMDIHRRFWQDSYNFYLFVFREICEHLLLIGD
mgnify:CR=1 FL=1